MRYIKALGLAFVAALALSAVVASAASAQGKLTSDGPVTLDATETGGVTANSLTAFGNATRCPGSSYTGHEYNKTPHALIPSGASTATFTPKYVNCVSIQGGSELPTTVDMNGCDYVMHIGATVGVGKTYAATADVVCPAGQHILVTAFSGGGHAFRLCTVTVGPQTGLAGAHFTDTGNGHVDLTGTFKGIKSSRSGLCGASSTETAEFHIDVTGSGTNAAGGATPVSLSH